MFKSSLIINFAAKVAE